MNVPGELIKIFLERKKVAGYHLFSERQEFCAAYLFMLSLLTCLLEEVPSHWGIHAEGISPSHALSCVDSPWPGRPRVGLRGPAQIQTLTPSCLACDLGSLLPLSVPQFPHLPS